MERSLSYNSLALLQENIPFTEAEIARIEEQRRVPAKTIVIILAVCTLLTMLFIAWCIKDNFISFKYADYLLFAGAGLVLFGFCYLIFWLLSKYDSHNWKKDKLAGKSRLTSVIINRDKTEYGEYLTFAGNADNKKIRIKVNQQEYCHYEIGAKIIVTYLKFSKEALEITKL